MSDVDPPAAGPTSPFVRQAPDARAQSDTDRSDGPPATSTTGSASDASPSGRQRVRRSGTARQRKPSDRSIAQLRADRARLVEQMQELGRSAARFERLVPALTADDIDPRAIAEANTLVKSAVGLCSRAASLCPVLDALREREQAVTIAEIQALVASAATNDPAKFADIVKQLRGTSETA